MGESNEYVGTIRVVTQQTNADLTPFTTFGVHGRTPLLITVESEAELKDALREHHDALVLGGGSNVLIGKDLARAVIRIAIPGRKVEDKGDVVHITVGGGENWHSFVSWCVDNDWGGLENLALIPGTVGAAPIQNIGAYGVEQTSRFVELTAVHRQTLEMKTFHADECKFGYRDSCFKHEFRDTYVISSVKYALTKAPHTVHASYKDVVEELSAHNLEPTIRNVFNSVVAIRTRKLPDPKVIGNAGSFFKNPVISTTQYNSILELHPEVPSYTQPNDFVKVPAAWLIDQCGWKGHREGHVGVHERQALVLVNTGDATGPEVLELSEKIQRSVFDRFGIQLEIEVNVW